MPINAHPEYIAAEGEYLQARTLEERIEKLKKMISCAPAHKSGENLRAQLKTRLKKLQEQLIKSKKAGKSSSVGIKKDDMQAVLVGKTNSGKSSLLKILTNSTPKIADYEFTTKNPVLGTLHYENSNIQIIEIPAIGSEFYAKGIVHTADTILVLVTSLKEIEYILKELKPEGKIIFVFNKIDLLDENEKRKIQATLQSKKHNFVLISTKTGEGIEELKNKIFQSFNKIRIYTKEPGKEKSNRPIILNPNSTTKDVAEKILKGFSKKVKETRIWGPSSKFSGQKVGLQHELKDLDVVEFRTK
jgi:hypothetical protein